MRGIASAAFVTRALVLACAPIVAATEPALARRGAPESTTLAAAVGIAGRAPRAVGHEAGLDFTFRLASGVDVPRGKPNVWAYVTSRFDPEAPLRLVVVFRGFLNCIASYTSPRGIPCTPGHPKRTGYDLPRQIERSGVRALVVLPELAYDERSSDPGRLGEPGGLRALLVELLERLEPVLGRHRLDDVARVAFVASSGGFQALEPVLAGGGVEARELILMDAFYLWNDSAMARFLGDHLGEFDPASPRPRRFTMIYSPTGGALERSLAFRASAQRWIADAGLTHLARFDASGHPAVADFRAPISIARAEMPHDEVVATYLWQVLAASGL